MRDVTQLLARLRGASPDGRRPEDGPETVLLLVEEPYLEFLLHRLDGNVEIARPERGMPVVALMAMAPDVVIGERDDPRLAELGEATDARIVAIVERRRRVELRHRAWHNELAKPFTDADVARAVGLPTVHARDPETGPLQRLLASVAPLRFATIALAAVLELLRVGADDQRAVLLGAAFVWATLRTLAGRHRPAALAVDVAVVVALLALTTGFSSSYGLLAVVVAVHAGLVLGWLPGAAVGVLLSVVALVAGVAGAAPVALQDVVLVSLIFPVAGFTAGLGAGLARERQLGSERVLVEANRQLRELQVFSRSVPGGLELETVAHAAVAELREETGAEATALLVDRGGHLSLVAAVGLGGTPSVLIGPEEPTFARVRRGRLTQVDTTVMDADEVGALRSFDTWVAEPLRWSGTTVGILLAAPGSGADERALHQRMQGLATETAVAVQNALLYQDLRSVTVDAERRRLAAEMHDGLAQVLAHLRFELDMLAAGATPPDEVPEEARRLARVADRALGEARSTITGLRASVATAGLAATLRDYVRDLRGMAGPGIDLEVSTDARLLPEVEREVFRLAQEAISNALRHAHAQRLVIGLRRIGDDVVLTVDDDGIGFDPDRPASTEDGRGVGLGALRERASRCGCELDIVSRAGGGTHVEVRCPQRLQVPSIPQEEHA